MDSQSGCYVRCSGIIEIVEDSKATSLRLKPAIYQSVRAYARSYGLTINGAMSVLLVHGLRAEGAYQEESHGNEATGDDRRG